MEEKLNKSFDWEETFKAALSKGDENTLEKVLRIFPGVWAGKGCIQKAFRSVTRPQLKSRLSLFV